MEDVDFAFIGDSGCTIYRVCLHNEENLELVKMTEDEKFKLSLKTEEVFFFLVDQGNKNGYNVDAILEIADFHGATCFQVSASRGLATTLYIMQRGIKVNSIRVDMVNWTAAFKVPQLTIPLMRKGINPYVIDLDGNSGKSLFPSSFVSDEAKRLLSTFSRSIHFSIEDIACEQSCPADCPSKFERHYYKDGPLVEMTEENRIGKGGFGMVYKQLFHGIPMAMKCTLLGEFYRTKDGGEQIRRLRTDARNLLEWIEANMAELRIQTATAGSGVIVPVAFVRQQDQEQDENGEWIAWNYDIYIYPLYDHNLYELHQNYYDQFNDEILRNVLCQCLTRICSIGKFNF